MGESASACPCLSGDHPSNHFEITRAAPQIVLQPLGGLPGYQRNVIGDLVQDTTRSQILRDLDNMIQYGLGKVEGGHHRSHAFAPVLRSRVDVFDPAAKHAAKNLSDLGTTVKR